MPTNEQCQRFDAYVRNHWSAPGQWGPCWDWLGSKDRHGYGVFALARGSGAPRVLAHRFAYERHVRLIPPPPPGLYHGFCVCHACDNRLCVNPDHLFLAPQHVNVRDAAEKRFAAAERRPRWNQRLSDEDVRGIRARYDAGALQRELAAAYGVRGSTISRVINGKRRLAVK